MQLKTINLKFSISKLLTLFSICIFGLGSVYAQEIIEDEVKQKDKLEDVRDDGKVKIDGVAAVIGDFIVLDSDIDKEFIQLRARGVSIGDISRCELFGSLLEDKLYAHSAIQDSITVNELEIQSMIDQQLEQFIAQTGSLDEVLKFYKIDTEQQLRTEMFEINKNQRLAAQMRRKIVEDIEVTPEEVREYFNSIPEDERPMFGTELKVAQIVVIPEVTEDAKNAAIEKLKGYRQDVIENGASFTTKAVFYSDDTGSKSTGGKYVLNKKRPQMVKEFREVAFSLQEGEISEPFETEYGYHIIFLEKIRGQEYDVRHILIRPEITAEAITSAREKIKKVRESIINEEISFEDAAREFSDEKETKFEGGKLTNPYTQDFNFELTKMEPELYSQIQDLPDGQVSEVLQDQDRVNTIKFKIMMVTDRIDEHEADFARDYLKIKNLALQNKQFEAISEWQGEKIQDTYIKINGEYRECEFQSDWLKNKS